MYVRLQKSWSDVVINTHTNYKVTFNIYRSTNNADVLEKYKDHLIYSTDDGESESYPCAIELTDNQWIQKYGIYDSCYFGVFSRSEQKDYYTKFADFLLNY